MASVYERISAALSSLGKRRERDGDGAATGAGGGGSGATPPPGGPASAKRAPKRFRPWAQEDLHNRLDTYKPLTWFAKPATVGPVPCALRGWVNDGCDTLTCEHCGAKLVYPPQVPYDQRQAAADMFHPALTTKHTNTCPWRQTACEQSLLQYVPQHTNDEMCQLFDHLQSKLLKIDVLPDLDAIAIQTIRDAAGPFGPYDDLVMGGHGASAATAIVPHRGTLPPRPTQVRIRELDDAGNMIGGSGASFSSDAMDTSAAGGGASAPPGGDVVGETYLVQPSKLTPQQKARLLALLGWDLDVLQPDTAGGSAIAPYAQNSGYSLGHLGVKPKSGKPPSAAAAGAGGTAAAAGGSGKVPMSQVVLKCPRCGGRMGLWNFAGVRPVPTGRLLPPTNTGAAALLSPARGASIGGGVGGSAAAAAGASVSAVGGADPLSATIAGGQYGPLAGGAAARPFGSAAAAAPFRFGAAPSTAPVFGIAALDEQASRAASSSFASATSAAAATGPSTAAQTPSKAPLPLPMTPAPHAGQKRKAPEAGAAGGLEAMALDATPVRTPLSAATEPKRPRLNAVGGAATPGPAGAGAEGMQWQAHPGLATPAAEGQPRDLDPVAQHRSWCPWVYTGAGDERSMSGWQHMLSALHQQQQQQQATAAAAAAAGAGAGGGGAASPGAGAGKDAKALRDSTVAAIRSL
ncbi:hypothetical protein HYH03_006096 [Edaphochlamys debaryana]|uniref:C3HC-type domain-containing protein n=1 Tax=Edaphochlamys debaryana TaxID=47281 RepID=A0A835Y4L1_9CHLO|nr:hypothetical protein HYH03_006096 [Edaphochlamys debaryana]|eukprot:KAG2495858.1 hypothetical protein HYH03_006096 [Edaphochlamys debaryana]